TSPQLDNDDLKQIDADDLEEMDLKWQTAMLTVRARRFLQRIGRNHGANRPTSMGFDISKVECYNCYKKGHFARECRSPKDTRRNAMTRVFRQKRNIPTMPSWYSHLQVLLVLTMSLPPGPIYDRYQSGDGYHDVPPPYTGIFMPPKPDLVFHNAPNVNKTVHTAFSVELKDDSETKIPQTVPSFVQPTEQVKYHRPSVQHVKTFIPAANPKTALPKPKIHGNSRNRKALFVCKSLTHLIKGCDYHDKKMAQTPAKNHAPRGHHQQYANMTLPNPQRHVAPPPVLSKSKLIPITVVRPFNATVLKPHVTRPRQAKTVVTKPNSPPRRHINHSPSPKASNFLPKVTAVKAPMVDGNPQHALKDKGVIDSGCSRNMTGNVSYLSDFEELNGGYVSFGGNPKGGKISGKEFEDFSDNNINEDNATGSLVPVVGKISTNNTNTFSAAELEDITYSNDEEDVGAEADFNNVGESNETKSERQVLSSKSENDTHTDDADINSVNEKQPMAEVQLSTEHTILANEQQHSEQSASVYDTYLLEKVDRNTTPESTDMSHRGGEIDQNADVKKCQVSCHLPDPFVDNMTTTFSNQFLESKNISLKKTVS
nr:hypothetical protein [Tanacetum cinerariifolium]GEY15086.1 hypothetical protein [Tanacetum cinerariifolium]